MLDIKLLFYRLMVRWYKRELRVSKKESQNWDYSFEKEINKHAMNLAIFEEKVKMRNV